MIFLVLGIIFILVSVSAVSATPASSDVYVAINGSDSNAGTMDSPFLTIAQGVASVAENGTVHIADGVYSGTGNVNITINQNMIIQGQSPAGTIINGDNSSWIFHIDDATVTIQGLTIVNATGNMWMGPVYNDYDGTLIVRDCNFRNNHASSGAGIFNDGKATVINCTFRDNYADEGGAIYQCDGTINIIGCTFINNIAEYDGGALFMDSETETNITGCIFLNNTAAFGGAICNSYGEEVNFKLTDSTIENNNAVERTGDGNYGGFGGGIYLCPWYDYSYEIIGNQILNNVGSGIYIRNSTGGPAGEAPSTFNNEILINFNRFYGNTPYGLYLNNSRIIGAGAVSNEGPVKLTAPIFDAKYNWWGSNNGPNATGADKTNLDSEYYAPWMIMRLDPSQVSISGGETTLLTASFLYDSLGAYHDPANGHIPDGTPVFFTTSLGQVGSSSILKYTSGGIATALLRAWNEQGVSVSGIAFITATTDAQTLSNSVKVNAAVNAANSVAMQNTGVPVSYLVMAVLMLLCGFLAPKRK